MKKIKVLMLSLLLAAAPLLAQTQTASAGAAGSAATAERLAGSNRNLTANAVAEKGWPNGASTVILVRDDDFPDALAGAPLAHKYDAPILLTNRYTLSPETAQEIAKLHATKVIILGSPYAVSTDIENALTALYGAANVERIGGTDRYDTAALIAQQVGGTSGQAVIAYGLDFPDALAVSPWAAKNGVPILLTETNSLPPATSTALTTLGVTKTAVVGSNVVISDAVYALLPIPTRYAGANRFETAMDICKRIGTDNSTALNPNNVFLATGMDFPDALAGSALAARNGNPIVLTDSTLSEPAITAYINEKRFEINNLTILGSETAVSPDVVNKVQQVIQNGNGTPVALYEYYYHLNKQYNGALIAGTPLKWDYFDVYDDTDGYLKINVVLDKATTTWDTIKSNNQAALETYLKSIVADAEKEYPNRLNHIKLSVRTSETFSSQQTNLPANATQKQLPYGGWIVLYTRTITYDSNGSIIVVFDPKSGSISF